MVFNSPSPFLQSTSTPSSSSTKRRSSRRFSANGPSTSPEIEQLSTPSNETTAINSPKKRTPSSSSKKKEKSIIFIESSPETNHDEDVELIDDKELLYETATILMNSTVNTPTSSSKKSKSPKSSSVQSTKSGSAKKKIQTPFAPKTPSRLREEIDDDEDEEECDDVSVISEIQSFSLKKLSSSKPSTPFQVKAIEVSSSKPNSPISVISQKLDNVTLSSNRKSPKRKIDQVDGKAAAEEDAEIIATKSPVQKALMNSPAIIKKSVEKLKKSLADIGSSNIDIEGKVGKGQEKEKEKKRSTGPKPLTVPKEFSFATDKRLKQKSVIGSAVTVQEDDLSSKKMIKKTFDSKKLTVQKPFNLSSGSRINSSSTGQVKTAVLKPSAVQGTSNKIVKQIKSSASVCALTVPKSPKFRSDLRKRTTMAAADTGTSTMTSQLKKEIKPISVGKKELQALKPSLTVPKEFNFQSETRIRKQPTPAFVAKPAVGKGSIQSKAGNRPTSLTAPKPFSFATDQRSKIKKSTSFSSQNESQSNSSASESDNSRKQKAKLVTASASFVPQKSTKPLSQPKEFILSSEKRAKERQYFEEQLKKKAEIEEIEKKEKERLEKIKEEKELKNHRQSLVHQAQPIKIYSPVVVKPSDTPLTVPTSPTFRIDKLLKGKKERLERFEGKRRQSFSAITLPPQQSQDNLADDGGRKEKRRKTMFSQ